MLARTWTPVTAVVMVVVVAVALVLAGCSNGSPGDNERVTVLPAHWWKTSLTEQQFHLLEESWGKELTAVGLVAILWPEILPELPQAMVSTWEGMRVQWPTSDWDAFVDMPMRSLSFGRGVPDDEGMSMYDFYLGTEVDEGRTLPVLSSLGVTSETRYRVSLYIDDVIG